ILIVVVIAAILILVPVWGITGASVAIALAFAINNLLRFYFLKLKYKLQPFSWKIFHVSIIFVLSYFISRLVPQLDLIIDIFVRSLLFLVVFACSVLIFRVSEDINELIYKLKSFLK